MRTFKSGATRDSEDGKYDYEGFLSPVVLERFAEYMHKHRYQANGEMRASDNWQKGMDLDVYMKSGFRHFMDWWLIHRTGTSERPEGGVVDIEDALCGVLFNVQGYLLEVLKEGVPGHPKKDYDPGKASHRVSEDIRLHRHCDPGDSHCECFTPVHGNGCGMGCDCGGECLRSERGRA